MKKKTLLKRKKTRREGERTTNQRKEVERDKERKREKERQTDSY